MRSQQILMQQTQPTGLLFRQAKLIQMANGTARAGCVSSLIELFLALQSFLVMSFVSHESIPCIADLSQTTSYYAIRKLVTIKQLNTNQYTVLIKSRFVISFGIISNMITDCTER